MMEMSFVPREDGHLEEQQRHISITPEEKMQEEMLCARAERRAERRAFQLEHRHDKFKEIRK